MNTAWSCEVLVLQICFGICYALPRHTKVGIISAKRYHSPYLSVFHRNAKHSENCFNFSHSSLSIGDEEVNVEPDDDGFFVGLSEQEV